MNIELLAEIQPYIDEYCYCKKEAWEPLKHGVVKNIEFIQRMNEAEKAIMQILIDGNCNEIQK